MLTKQELPHFLCIMPYTIHAEKNEAGKAEKDGIYLTYKM